MSNSGALIPHQPASWAEVRDLLGDADCAWADIDGWHETTCPDAPPPGCTHLWAWDESASWLLRPDGYGFMLVELRMSSADSRPASGVSVRYEIDHTILMPDGQDGIVQPSSNRFVVVRVVGVESLSFVRGEARESSKRS